MLKIKQLVYKFPSDDEKDISEEIKERFFGVDLVSRLKLNSILELGIQAKPNTIFEINGVEIVIGSSGRYELNLLPIKSLICSTKNHIENSRIIIDMIYEEEE